MAPPPYPPSPIFIQTVAENLPTFSTPFPQRYSVSEIFQRQLFFIIEAQVASIVMAKKRFLNVHDFANVFAIIRNYDLSEPQLLSLKMLALYVLVIDSDLTFFQY